MVELVTVGDELVNVRHRLHAHPELGFREFDTTAYLVSQLTSHGITVAATPMKTGVVAVIDGGRPGPRIGLRADIDGLPVEEDTGLAFSSLNPGVMHACGHDLHMSGLLGAAWWLAAHREAIAGSVVLLFQPAEETGRGARSVIDADVLGHLDAFIAIHNNPDYAPGEIAIGTEPMMAGCVKFSVGLHAEGTHAGYPHMGTGPIEALASMILSLQTIVSRNSSPFHPLVLSVTAIHGGEVWNVVPAEAGFMGTVRYFHHADGQMVERRFRQIVESTAHAYGIGADVQWDDFQDPLVSDPDLAVAVAGDVDGYARLRPISPSMAGEDFCEFARMTRLIFAFVGSNGTEGHHDWHSPQFVGFDATVQTAVRFYVNAALRALRELA